MDSYLLKLAEELLKTGSRSDAGRQLAAFTGARDLIIFLRDEAAGAYLPASGFPQTLPNGVEWREFVSATACRGEYHESLEFPTAKSRVSASGYTAAGGAVLVLLGGDRDEERTSQLRAVLPLLAFGLGQERRAQFREVESSLARESAAEAKRLAETVDAVRRQLDRQFEYTRAITDSLGEAVFTTDVQARITFVNPVAERVLGWTARELIGKKPAEIICTNPQNSRPPAELVLTGGKPVRVDRDSFNRKGGGVFPARYTAAPICTAGEVKGAVVVFEDLTEQDHTEQQLRETQKLESIGLLAGGIAHDFNNLLVGVLGNASLLLDEAGPGHPWEEMLSGILASGQRAADLTRQLLAYAGKGQFVITAIDVSEVTMETMKLVRASVSKNVDLQSELGTRLPTVEGDRTQIQQLLMNLMINGAEAVGPETKGTVRVSTGTVFLNEADSRHLTIPNQLPSGSYVWMEVQDSGCGMNEVTRSRIFEPFFTTKFLGRGLGLSAALGIVRSHHGALEVRSTPGKGSTFRILLPAKGSAAAQIAPCPKNTGVSKRGTVLVIDDEGMVRLTIKTTLLRAGYHVVLIDNAPWALRRMAEDPSRYDLVLLDFAMPIMSGEEAFGKIRSIRSDVPVLLMSGYSEFDVTERFGVDKPSGFLQKPFTADQLLQKVHATLEHAIKGASGG